MKRQQRHARLETEALDHARRLNRNFRQFFAVGISCTVVSATNTNRPLVKIMITPMGRPAFRQSSTSRTSLQARRIAARHACHHCVGIDRAPATGSIDVAVVAYHADAIAIERAATLQAPVKRIGVRRSFFGGSADADFQPTASAPGVVQAGVCNMFARNKNCLAEAGSLERRGCADDRLFLAFGKNHALGIGAHTRGNVLEETSRRDRAAPKDRVAIRFRIRQLRAAPRRF